MTDLFGDGPLAHTTQPLLKADFSSGRLIWTKALYSLQRLATLLVLVCDRQTVSSVTKKAKPCDFRRFGKKFLQTSSSKFRLMEKNQ